MAYSSYSPNEERFGFSIKSSFRCGYENERLIVIIFLIAIAAMLIGAAVCFATASGMLFTPVDVNAAADAIEKGERNFIGFNAVEYAGLSVLQIALICGALGLIVVFCVVAGILRWGRRCDFKANENYMELVLQGRYPRTIVIYYNDVISVTASERKFLFLSGLDVTVQTKKKTFLFRFIHDHLSKNGGLSETPFNIICERAEIVSKPKYRP